MIERYRTGIPELREQYIVGPGARRSCSPLVSPPMSPPRSPKVAGPPSRVDSFTMEVEEFRGVPARVDEVVDVPEAQTPLLPHTHVMPSLLLPDYHVAAEAYYVPPVPTRVYTRPPAWQHFLISLAISLGSVVMAIFFPNIQTVFSLLGGICSSFLCFVFPAMCVKRLGYCTVANTGLPGVVGIEALLWGGSAAGVFSTALTVYNTVTG